MNATRRKGSISLEAALVMPMVLLLTGLMIIGIICIEAEIKIKGALDRTAAELALITPVGHLLANPVQAVRDTLESGLGDTGATSDSLIDDLLQTLPWQSLLTDLLLDVTSTALAGPAIQNRLNHWLSDACGNRPALAARVGRRQLFLDWQLDKNQLWLCLSYQLSTPIGPLKRQAYAVVPLWVGMGGDPVDRKKDDVWLLDNFSRGKQIRAAFGANLPDDFPVIAGFDHGEAVMIKSMDLTAPTYADPNLLQRRLDQHLSNLTGFSGASYQKGGQDIHLQASSITSRRLILVIPDNCNQEFLPEMLMTFAQKAKDCFVSLQIVRYGNSARYQTMESPAAD